MYCLYCIVLTKLPYKRLVAAITISLNSTNHDTQVSYPRVDVKWQPFAVLMAFYYAHESLAQTLMSPTYCSAGMEYPEFIPASRARLVLRGTLTSIFRAWVRIRFLKLGELECFWKIKCLDVPMTILSLRILIYSHDSDQGYFWHLGIFIYLNVN